MRASSDDQLRTFLIKSMNRHWLARLVIGAWAVHIPVFAFLAPTSLSGRGMEAAGPMGHVMMLTLLALAAFALADTAVNDILPDRFTSCLRHYRHVGFMLMAMVLVITGGGIAISTRTLIILPSFLLPALFCVVVTGADLYSRHKGVV